MMRKIAVPALLLLLVAAFSGCIVSKKDYLLKSDEADRFAVSYREQKEKNDALTKDHQDLLRDHKNVTEERDLLKSKLEIEQAVAEELRVQNQRLNNIILTKEVSQTRIIKDTMEINKKLQETNTGLREKLVIREDELKRLKADYEYLQKRKKKELTQLKTTYDELVDGLKSEIEAGEVQIRRMKDRLSVNLVEKILFDSGKAELKPTGVKILRKIGAELAKIEGKRIQIEGHTDNVPIGGRLKEKFPTNWELSASRALAVVRILQADVGIDPTLLSSAGYGEYQPVVSNETAEGKAANRRIEIVLLPLYEKISEASESTE
ncbi:MAG: OmpA family protein [bacterium]